jgi:hypothetical protein
MQSKLEIDHIAKALADEWGQDAIETEQNKIYIQFTDDITASLMVDCDLGVSHCLADLPKAFPPSLVPETFEDLCIYANRLNITLARELGVAQSFQVLDDTLKLNDTRPFQGVEDIVEVCDTQARDNMSLMKAVISSLSEAPGKPVEIGNHLPESAILI